MKGSARQYQESRILTAPQEELLIMLLDGAVRFAQQAKTKAVEKKYDESCKLYIRAQRIMIELITSLDARTIDPQLYANLVNLYHFVYWRLVRTNLNHDGKLADEALTILGHLRETWALAVEKLRKEQQLPAEPAAAPSAGLDVST